jgi:thiamine-monophosphate kinase
LSTESTFIDLMRAIATDPAARGLNDDAAVIEFGNEALILTHDMMVEGVHWLPGADPADVAWKLVAANLSDLAAKGAEPLGVLLGFMLGADDWDRRFAEGLAEVLATYTVPLLGGDTTGKSGEWSARAFGLTALGRATHRPVPARSGAQEGDWLYVTGTVGDAAAGFDLCREAVDSHARLRRAFNRPVPQLEAGKLLAPEVHAMMDVSDGLLLDAQRMAKASGLRVEIDLSTLPISHDYQVLRGNNLESRLVAASWGDDYQLLFATPTRDIPVDATLVGGFWPGEGINLRYGSEAVPLPASLGYEHR